MQHTISAVFARAIPAASVAVLSITLSAQQMPTSPQSSDPTHQAATPATKQIQAASLNAELTKSIDTKKARTGDEVNAKTTADAKLPDGTDLPKGTKLVGNVIEVTPKSKEQKNSHLVISLSRAVTKDGKDLPIRAAVTSMTGPAMAQSMDTPSSPSAGGMASAGGSGDSSGGAGAGSAAVPAQSMPAASASIDPQTQQGAMLKSAQDRVPVANMPNVVLSAPTTPESAGVLDAQNQNINLSSGTRFTVNVSPALPGPAQGGE